MQCMASSIFMFKVLEEEQADYVAVAFDLHAPTFRHKMYEAYKGTRKPMPEELREQVPLMKEVLDGHGRADRGAGRAMRRTTFWGRLARRSEEQGLLGNDAYPGTGICCSWPRTRSRSGFRRRKRNRTEIEDYYTTEVLEKYQVTPTAVHRSEGINGRYCRQHPGCAGSRGEDGDKDHRGVWFGGEGL